MGSSTTHTITMARPNDGEIELFYKLYYAAQRVEDRWCRNTVGPIADELSHCPNLTREEKMLLLRAWQVLVDGIGGFGRFMGAFDTYVHNMQDPGVGHVAYKPSLVKLFEDAELLPVMTEAYAEALADRDSLQAAAQSGRDEWLAQEDRAELAEQSSKELEESLGIANAATQSWKDRAKAAERLLQQPIPALGSVEVNDAAWKLHDLLTEHGPLNGHQFNNLKGCFYEAVKTCFKVEEA